MITRRMIEAAARCMAEWDARPELGVLYPEMPLLDPEKTWPQYVEMVIPILEAAEKVRP